MREIKNKALIKGYWISGVCDVCGKEFKIEELRQENNIFVKINQTDGLYTVEWMCHSHCQKLEGDMLTLGDYLEMINNKKVAKQIKNPIETFLENFHKTFVEVITKEYPKQFTEEDLKNLTSIATKWMEGCDLKKVKVEDCVNWFVKDLKKGSTDNRYKLSSDFIKYHSLQNHLMDNTLQNMADELAKNKKGTINNDKENCCVIIKEGLRDILKLALDLSDKARLFDCALITFGTWKALKNKCNHCLKIETQTKDILTKHVEE